MANPLSNESEMYERIKQENIKVHPIVWELIDHYISNDLYAVHLIAGSHISDGEAIPPEDGKKLIARCNEITKFLRKLKEATREVKKG